MCSPLSLVEQNLKRSVSFCFPQLFVLVRVQTQIHLFLLVCQFSFLFLTVQFTQIYSTASMWVQKHYGAEPFKTKTARLQIMVSRLMCPIILSWSWGLPPLTVKWRHLNYGQQTHTGGLSQPVIWLRSQSSAINTLKSSYDLIENVSSKGGQWRGKRPALVDHHLSRQKEFYNRKRLRS